MPIALPNGRDVDALARDLLALEEDTPGVDGLEQVDAAQKRALAAAARADDDEDFARSHLQVDAVEDEEVAEALANVLEPDHRRVGAVRHLARRPCRLDRQSSLLRFAVLPGM